MKIQASKDSVTNPEDVNLTGTEAQKPATPFVSGGVTQQDVGKALETLKKYRDGKKTLEERIIANEQWYKGQHWDAFRNKHASGANASRDRAEPTSAWLFNAIANKHADAMDNYPEPSVLPREQADENDAKVLSSIMPVILERNRYEQVYNDAWWDKLKNGTRCTGVFWDKSIDNGLGDVSVRNIDLLNVFWQPGIRDIQKSRNLFIVDMVDNDIVFEKYPEAKKNLSSKTIDVKEYVHDDNVDTTDKTLVVDWYYKKNIEGRTVLHFCKLVGDFLAYSSENDPELRSSGWYNHGKYPIVFDVLYPEAGTPVGFGYVDICKDPQMYIDKLDQIVLENSIKVSRQRYFYKESNGVDMDAFADLSKDFVSVKSGSLGEDSLMPIEQKPIDMNLINIINHKVDELKETAGNRDVNQGSSSGVTAAAAIAALQEAGNKLSRDIIKASYRADTEVNYLIIELIRQFYTLERTFRITGDDGSVQYVAYSNQSIAPQPVPVDNVGMEMTETRVPIFDIKVKAQRSNPFSRMAQNELAKELFQAGIFNPEIADQSLIMLDMMDFEGKDALVERLRVNKIMFEQKQAQAALMALIQQTAAQGGDVSSDIAQLMASMGGPTAGPTPAANPANASAGKSSIPANNGIAGAVRNQSTPYAETLRKRAQANVEG